jgi:AcrR family transcriptional regulator
MAAAARVRGEAAVRAGRSRGVAASGLPSEHVAAVQRARLLGGAVRAVDELGYTRATVTDITHCARVSRRTFYELFSNREECMLALLESMLERVRAQLELAQLDGLSWRERIRGGLWAILTLLDREPALARVCVVESARGGQRMLERRGEILGELVAFVDDGRREGARGGDCPPLTAEGLVGAALSIVHARLLRGESGPLSSLAGELTGMLVLPYLGPAAARRERERPTITPDAARMDDATGETAQAPGDPLSGIPMRLTYRTMRVLEAVAEHPGVSNRVLGERAGISDQGQVSKLLARLEHYGLLENRSEGHSKGEPNAWHLSSRGLRVTQTIGAHAGGDTHTGTGGQVS